MSQLIRTHRMIALGTLIFFALGATVVSADRKADLQKHFKERFAALEQLRSDGKLGETFDGRAEAVKEALDRKSADIVADENTDRKELYQIIADEEKTTPELVAKRYAQRRYNRAQTGFWFKYPNGEWKKKEK